MAEHVCNPAEMPLFRASARPDQVLGVLSRQRRIPGVDRNLAGLLIHTLDAGRNPALECVAEVVYLQARHKHLDVVIAHRQVPAAPPWGMKERAREMSTQQWLQTA
mmetsp:Transcript_65326/g.206411  ORF Transcript_65326/g.206411 Transcript_65326/m.206411 type:complete len:106 (-) Transcript_65326:11-328(-)